MIPTDDQIQHLRDEVADLDKAREAIDLDPNNHRAKDDAELAADMIGEQAARISGGEYRPAYNGWKNRETWNASLWINNDEGSYNQARAIAQEALNTNPAEEASLLPADYWTPETVRRSQIRAAGEALREWFDEANDPSPDDPGPAQDAWTYALACVDWYAVADGIAEGMEPDDSDADR